MEHTSMDNAELPSYPADRRQNHRVAKHEAPEEPNTGPPAERIKITHSGLAQSAVQPPAITRSIPIPERVCRYPHFNIRKPSNFPKPAVIGERNGEIEFRAVNNDGARESMIILTGLKCIFCKVGVVTHSSCRSEAAVAPWKV